MKLIASLCLFTAALGNPLASPARMSAEAAQAQTCSILGSNVNCRYHPTTDSTVVKVLSKGTSLSFSCWQYGSCASGGCSGATCGSGNCNVWDYNPQYDCFVNAHYTSGACTTKSISQCGFSKE